MRVRECRRPLSRAGTSASCSSRRGWRPAMPPVEKVAYYVGLGGAVGIASGALGIGAGTMMSVGLALASLANINKRLKGLGA